MLSNSVKILLLLLTLACTATVTCVESAHATPEELEAGIKLFQAGMGQELQGITLEIKPYAKHYQASAANNVIYLNMDAGADKPVFSPLFDRDVYALILCHELGHVIGGLNISNSITTSVEGEADYFAAATCAPKVFKDHAENERSNQNRKIDSDLMAWCTRHQTSARSLALCLRTGSAALVLVDSISKASLTASTVSQPKITTPDCSHAVQKYSFSGTIRSKHPIPQCRLDTYMRAIFHLPRPACWYNVESSDKAEYFTKMDTFYNESNICQKSCKSLHPAVSELEREQRCLGTPCMRVLYPMLYSDRPLDSINTDDQIKAFELAKILASGNLKTIQSFIDSGKSWCTGPKFDIDCVNGSIKNIFVNCAK